jgi:hypothetical protein
MLQCCPNKSNPQNFKTGTVLAKASEKIDQAWKSGVTGWVVISICAAFSTYGLIVSLSATVATIVLAVAGAIFGVRAEAKGSQKFVWTLLLFALAWITIRSTDAEQRAATNAQREAFKKVLEQEQKQYDKTRDDTSTLLAEIQTSVSFMTGGVSKPYIFVQIANRNLPPSPLQLMPAVDGRNPLRNFSVDLGQARCDIDPKTRTGMPGGSLVFQHSYETYSGPTLGDGYRTRMAFFTLVSQRAVFFGDASALNGNWFFLVKFRFENGRWEWRSTVYDRWNRFNMAHVVKDIFSDGFPAAERRRPILPLTEDDCGVQ